MLNLQTQNKALLLRYLHKLYKLIWNLYYINQPPHASQASDSFWWKDVTDFVTDYSGSNMQSECRGYGTIMERLTEWKCISLKFPGLLSFVKDQDIAVKRYMQDTDQHTNYYLPLSTEAHNEYVELQQMINNVYLQDTDLDSWTYSWGQTNYSSSRYYKFIQKNMQAPILLSGSGKVNVYPNLRCLLGYS